MSLVLFRFAFDNSFINSFLSAKISSKIVVANFFFEFQAGGADSAAQKLNMKNVGGVFVVLFGGCGVAMVLGLFRWYYNIKQMAKTLDVRLKNS